MGSASFADPAPVPGSGLNTGVAASGAFGESDSTFAVGPTGVACVVGSMGFSAGVPVAGSGLGIGGASSGCFPISGPTLAAGFADSVGLLAPVSVTEAGLEAIGGSDSFDGAASALLAALTGAVGFVGAGGLSADAPLTTSGFDTGGAGSGCFAIGGPTLAVGFADSVGVLAPVSVTEAGLDAIGGSDFFDGAPAALLAALNGSDNFGGASGFAVPAPVKGAVVGTGGPGSGVFGGAVAGWGLLPADPAGFPGSTGCATVEPEAASSFEIGFGEPSGFGETASALASGTTGSPGFEDSSALVVPDPTTGLGLEVLVTGSGRFKEAGSVFATEFFGSTGFGVSTPVAGSGLEPGGVNAGCFKEAGASGTGPFSGLAVAVGIPGPGGFGAAGSAGLGAVATEISGWDETIAVVTTAAWDRGGAGASGWDIVSPTVSSGIATVSSCPSVNFFASSPASSITPSVLTGISRPLPPLFAVVETDWLDPCLGLYRVPLCSMGRCT